MREWSSAEELFTEVRSCSFSGIEEGVSEVNEFGDVFGDGTNGEWSKSMISMTLVWQ